ncbi:MAG TPA: glycosyltransferase [Gemmatimonadales bacterium]|nr:glycosyltransferase [Gemmatimonadales bacterium]
MSSPRLTVVVPTYQRRDSVLRLLGSLAAQTAPAGAFDVVVAVDGSTDGTADAVRRYAAPFSVTVVEAPNRGRARACNGGVRAATGDLLILLDDDMEAAPGLVEAHARAHGRTAPRAVVGAAPIVTSPDSPPFVRYMADGFQTRLDRLGRPGYRLRFRDTYTGNFSVRRDVFQSVGGFDESFQVYGHEDYELALRLEKLGVELAYSQEAVAWQHYEKSFGGFARDAIARGRTAVLFAGKHPEVVESIKLAEYARAPIKWRLMRGLLLRAGGLSDRVPALVIAAVDAAERRRSPQLERWYRYAIDFFYWYGVRQARRERPASARTEPATAGPPGLSGMRDA